MMQQPWSQTGLKRSVDLMRALGPEARAVWQGLSPEESARLSEALHTLPASPTAERSALDQCVDMLRQPQPDTPSPPRLSIWQTLDQMPGSALARLLDQESPLLLAIIMTKLGPARCAGLVGALAPEKAAATLHQLLSLRPLTPAALATIEAGLSKLVAAAGPAHAHYDDRVAEIFDQLDSPTEDRLLEDLEAVETGLRARIQKMMFCFEDIRHLDPASLQTLLSHCDRQTLIRALTDADARVRSAVFQNMTRRAADLLQAEIRAMNVDSSRVAAARLRVIALIRDLARRGDILIPVAPDHELIA